MRGGGALDAPFGGTGGAAAGAGGVGPAGAVLPCRADWAPFMAVGARELGEQPGRAAGLDGVVGVCGERARGRAAAGVGKARENSDSSEEGTAPVRGERVSGLC